MFLCLYFAQNTFSMYIDGQGTCPVSGAVATCTPGPAPGKFAIKASTGKWLTAFALAVRRHHRANVHGHVLRVIDGCMADCPVLPLVFVDVCVFARANATSIIIVKQKRRQKKQEE